MHGCEIYLTESLTDKIRDNYHTILIAKNSDGFEELNLLIDLSTDSQHMYYKPRLSFDEFLNISNNIIKISACLQSPLNRIGVNIESADDVDRVDRLNSYYEKLITAYDYYEIQPHVNSDEQRLYNKKLYELSKITGIPLIAGTDTHSINHYKAECRTMQQYSKNIIFDNEDVFDLTYKTYDELVEMFKRQDALPNDVICQAIENTNIMSDSVYEFDLDLSFKYPKIEGKEEELFKERVNRMYVEKLINGVISNNKRYLENIKEEFRVLKKIGMLGFIYFMSELCCWCHENDIPTGFCRGSIGGSYIAYILDIIDLNPLVWGTKFSRFANEDRIEIGDIDIDFAPEDRERVYEYIIGRFGLDKTAYILTTNTSADKGSIDDIVRGYANKYRRDNNLPKDADTPYSLEFAKKIKQDYEVSPEEARAKYKEVFYYFDGMKGCVVSKGIHPAGIVASPITLPDNYGTFWYDGKRVMSINMEEIHIVSLVKYDILGLKNIGIIKAACKLIGIPYPKSHEIDWLDKKVWDDMVVSHVGIFQFESLYAFDLLKRFKPQKVNDMSLVNASLRPSGESYRDRLIARKVNNNPSEIIDELLKDNNGYLVFQEDVTKFLQDICGLSGSRADNVRRAIGRKQIDRLQEALPEILEGYCSKSTKQRDVAEEEAKVFLKIIEDASSYMFGYNHSTGYSMIGYLCAYLRFYYPAEFITSYLNNSDNDDDILLGTELAEVKGININGVKFRYSRGKYFLDDKKLQIYKGIASIKFLNNQVADQLYNLRDLDYSNFIELLEDLNNTSINSRQLKILIEVGFFDEFGDINYLSNISDWFLKLYEKKSIKVDSLEKIGLTYEDLMPHTNKFTGKTYSGINSMELIKSLEKQIPKNTTTLKDIIRYQMQHIGSIDIKDKRYSGLIVVQKIDTKYTPKLKVYSLANGITADVKIDKKVFDNKTLNKGDIIRVIKQSSKPKYARLPEGGYMAIEGTKEIWISNYEKVEFLYTDDRQQTYLKKLRS